ncbi:MAG: hypothetical protein ABI834_08930 [Ginsengibacter sp.]
MELDDLKNTWEDVNNQVKTQQNLTTKMINQMTQTKYYSSLKKIAYPEIIGAIICFIGAAFIATNFSKLDTTFLKCAGIISILLLLTLPVISLISLRQFNMPGDVNKPHAETLKKFAIQKIRFHKFQRINITLSYILLVTIIILFSKLFGRNSISDSKYFWTFSFSLGYIFLLFFSKWVSKNYNNALRQAEELLKELES